MISVAQMSVQKRTRSKSDRVVEVYYRPLVELFVKKNTGCVAWSWRTWRWHPLLGKAEVKVGPSSGCGGMCGESQRSCLFFLIGSFSNWSFFCFQIGLQVECASWQIIGYVGAYVNYSKCLAQLAWRLHHREKQFCCG